MFSPHTPASQVTRLSIQKSGGLEAASMVTGLCKATLSNYQNEAQNYHTPLPVAAELDRFTDKPYHLMWLCSQLGYQVPALKSDETPVMGIVESVLGASKHMGDVAGATEEAMRDRHFSPNELRQIRNEVRETVRALEVILASLDAYEFGPKVVRAAE